MLLNKSLSEIKNHFIADAESKPFLMTHVIIGYPNLEESLDIVRLMAAAGVKLIELQIPFSDPIADGPSIMHACETAIENGVNTADCLQAMKTLSSEVSIPLLFMSYYNLIFTFPGGPKGFIEQSQDAGASALIVPDVPLEEDEEQYWKPLSDSTLTNIPLVSPVTPSSRMQKIAEASDKNCFVYCVSTTGTTGARKSLSTGLGEYLATVKQHFEIPRAVGFGISSPEHIDALKGHAEIAVIGSAVIDLISKTSSTKRLDKIQQFIENLR